MCFAHGNQGFYVYSLESDFQVLGKENKFSLPPPPPPPPPPTKSLMRLIKPKAEEIFLQTVSMWVLQLKFSSIDTPRDFVEDTCSMVWCVKSRP